MKTVLTLVVFHVTPCWGRGTHSHSLSLSPSERSAARTSSCLMMQIIKMISLHNLFHVFPSRNNWGIFLCFSISVSRKSVAGHHNKRRFYIFFPLSIFYNRKKRSEFTNNYWKKKYFFLCVPFSGSNYSEYRHKYNSRTVDVFRTFSAALTHQIYLQ